MKKKISNRDFLNFLESFPGKEKLKSSEKGELVLEYLFIDFSRLNQKFAKISNVKLSKDNEELWYKLMAFICLEKELTGEMKMYQHNNFNVKLDLETQKYADIICMRFNDRFYQGRKVIYDLDGIKLEELIQFAQSGEYLI